MLKDEDVSVYICVRVADMPTPKPEALVGQCDECKEKIYKMPHAPTHMPVICYQCAMGLLKKLDGDDEVTFLPGIMAQLEVN